MKHINVRTFVLALSIFIAAGSAHADLFVTAGEVRSASAADGRVINHGVLTGTQNQPLVFGPQSEVSGSGHFVGTLTFGVFAPGNSPGVTTGANQGFGATSVIEIELGGTVPGFGVGRHDQINDSATIWLFDSPKLTLLPFNSYVPSAGDEFVIMTWQQGLVGSFGSIDAHPFFAANGIVFTPVFTNSNGSGNLTLKVAAVPEAGTIAMFAIAAAGAGIAAKLESRRRRRQRERREARRAEYL